MLTQVYDHIGNQIYVSTLVADRSKQGMSTNPSRPKETEQQKDSIASTLIITSREPIHKARKAKRKKKYKLETLSTSLYMEHCTVYANMSFQEGLVEYAIMSTRKMVEIMLK